MTATRSPDPSLSLPRKEEEVSGKKSKRDPYRVSPLSGEPAASARRRGETNAERNGEPLAEGTKPQCQPIDLRCSLRGPLLRREKNKLIEGAESLGWVEEKRKKDEGRTERRSGLSLIRREMEPRFS